MELRQRPPLSHSTEISIFKGKMPSSTPLALRAQVRPGPGSQGWPWSPWGCGSASSAPAAWIPRIEMDIPGCLCVLLQLSQFLPFSSGKWQLGSAGSRLPRTSQQQETPKSSVCWCEGRINSNNPDTSAQVKGKLRYARGCSADFWGEQVQLPPPASTIQQQESQPLYHCILEFIPKTFWSCLEQEPSKVKSFLVAHVTWAGNWGYFWLRFPWELSCHFQVTSSPTGKIVG